MVSAMKIYDENFSLSFSRELSITGKDVDTMFLNGHVMRMSGTLFVFDEADIEHISHEDITKEKFW